MTSLELISFNKLIIVDVALSKYVYLASKHTNMKVIIYLLCSFLSNRILTRLPTKQTIDSMNVLNKQNLSADLSQDMNLNVTFMFVLF